jgi:hypothetical protein
MKHSKLAGALRPYLVTVTSRRLRNAYLVALLTVKTVTK